MTRYWPLLPQPFLLLRLCHCRRPNDCHGQVATTRTVASVVAAIALAVDAQASGGHEAPCRKRVGPRIAVWEATCPHWRERDEFLGSGQRITDGSWQRLRDRRGQEWIEPDLSPSL
ncbi:hypothetical protein Zm00014a_040883 [Zea mays]|uniref:Secreted protein n=1 Tax=Zea mays TaxID=4577 RepID=A0A3L6FG31_MAIZE|nr:hypothetical protein Zm00014a_040883 [Zea mays]